MSGGYIDCVCCGQTDMVSNDRDVLCDDCIQADCSEDGDDCQIPQCPDCDAKASYCTDDHWHSNCDDDCPGYDKSWPEARRARKPPPHRYRVPTAWQKTSRWSEKLRPFVLDTTTGPKLVTYADGGYPVYYVAQSEYEEQTVICPKCATDAHEWGDEGTHVVDVDVNWEDPDLYCDCGNRIESAYT